jgi:thiamine biosynthesis lipoprotein ApbE
MHFKLSKSTEGDTRILSIRAPDCIAAGSYTKPVCVLGPEAGFKIIESTPGAAAFMEREIESADGTKKHEPLEIQRFAQFLT